MNTTTQKDPKATNYGNRHNPTAWRDCTVPPTGKNDPHDPAFPSWDPMQSPSAALEKHLTRASHLTAFLHHIFSSSLARMDERAIKDDHGYHDFDADRAFVAGLVDMTGVIGEQLDLARQAGLVSFGRGNGR
ncbi:MAG: hypothetical protein HQL97_01020 [Magnetococcales bacterium]|nr:hypothetical protein [Magnetococcales bacterium]